MNEELIKKLEQAADGIRPSKQWLEDNKEHVRIRSHTAPQTKVAPQGFPKEPVVWFGIFSPSPRQITVGLALMVLVVLGGNKALYSPGTAVLMQNTIGLERVNSVLPFIGLEPLTLPQASSSPQIKAEIADGNLKDTKKEAGQGAVLETKAMHDEDPVVPNEQPNRAIKQYATTTDETGSTTPEKSPSIIETLKQIITLPVREEKPEAAVLKSDNAKVPEDKATEPDKPEPERPEHAKKPE